MLTFALSTLPNVDGSAMVEAAGSKVIASSSGPHELKLGLQRRDRSARLEVVVRSESVETTTEGIIMDRKVSSLIHRVLSSTLLLSGHGFARSGCTIVVQRLTTSTWWRTLATSINAATLAALDNGLPMKGLALASAAVIVKGEVYTEPTRAQEDEATSKHVLAFVASQSGNGEAETILQLVLIESKGVFQEDEFNLVFEECRKDTLNTLQLIRTALQK